MEEQFDYNAAVAELEKIAAKVEDPATGLDEIDRCIRRSDELIARCRDYLRTVRNTVDNL
jgi:exonuclease VII small subunit